MLREEHGRSIEIVEGVLAVAEHTELEAILADALVTKGTALTGVARLREGLAVIEAGERLASSIGLTSTALRALNNRLSSQWVIDPLACVEDARSGLALARRIGDRSWIFNLREKFEQFLWLTGDWDTALADGLAGMEEEPEPADRLTFLRVTTFVHAARGVPVGQALKELASTAALVTDPQVLWIRYDTTAFAAFAEDRLAEAGETWREGARRYTTRAHDLLYRAATTALLQRDAPAAARDLAEFDAIGLRAPLIAARRTVLRAGLSALEGSAHQATGMFDAALRQFRGLGLPFEEASAAMIMATVLDPRTPEVRAAVTSADVILSRLSAAPFLDRLDKLAQPAGRVGEVHGGPLQTNEAVAADVGSDSGAAAGGPSL
jgi:hypothetical protein